ncbi:MAG TPA: PAS domain S-box protein [Pyrinomonadaceae bacterium]|nr:PAS domain S-box protein [Pyrinomonadaceae bacterium]
MSRSVEQRKQFVSPVLAKLPLITPELYREIFVHSKEAIAIISPQGHYLEQNGAHYKLLGYSDDELQNETPALHLGEAVFAKIASELACTGTYYGEVTSRTKDGRERHLELSAFAVRNSMGEPFCYVGIKRDVTARKHSEESLRRSETELADFFETASVGMHWVGANGRVLRVNQAELDLLGYTREEYVGRAVRDFYVEKEFIDDLLARLQTGENLQDCEARMRAKDGSIKNVQISSSVLWENGKFVHTRSFTRDITERRRAQQRLALQYAVTRVLSESLDFSSCASELLRTIGECLGWEVGALWQVDPQANVLYLVDMWHSPEAQIKAFEALCRKVTFARGIGLPGRIWGWGAPVWLPNVLEDSNFPRGDAAKSAGLRGAFGFPIRIGNEVLGVIEFFSQEIRQPDEELLQVMTGLGGQIGQFKERARAERELGLLLGREKLARAEAEQANRLKDEFLATLSHELRTPLNAVIGWSRMLRSGRLDKDSALHALEVIERNAWAQQQIIEDILDVSRVITGKLQLNLGPVRIGSVVEAALDAVRPAIQAKEITITTSIEPNLRPISGDADRLQQVVWNLLSNAVKFTPANGEVAVRVSQHKSQLQITVTDSGPGIAPEFLPHVFERFRQADGSTTRIHGGLGLGLAIVRHLVELHGGTISAENRNKGSQGAVFIVRLPLPSGELSTGSLRESLTTSQVDPSAINLEGVHVLVVDDDVDALELINIELTGHGAIVKVATTGEEALAAMNEAKFDVLVADIGMPGMDGYELIRQVRRNEGKGQRTPAVALTAYARVQDRMRAMVAGYNTHAVKPIESYELLTVVASLSGRLDRS